MFAVVKFLPTDPQDCEEVEAVPVGWLSPGKTHCSWPALKSSAAIARAIRNHMPPGPNWNNYNAAVIKICGTACIVWNLFFMLRC